jgi:hypothetical protein
MKLRAALILALALPALAQTPAAPSANYDETKVGSYTLPDPLRMNDGAPVRTARDWTEKRRPEILELFAENVFGHSPQPRKLRYRVFDTDAHALGGKAIRKQVTIYFSDKDDGPKEDLLLYLPANSKGRVPVFLTLNFNGNHTVVNDPGVKLKMVWDRRAKTKIQAQESSRGSDKGWQVEKVLARGYGFATIDYQDIEPDFAGAWELGIRKLFLKPGQTAPAADDWGSIGAWSYGLSRAMDYLETQKGIDAHRVAVMGHSRLGKTILWAGALDQRFAMVIANCPGEGGASLARRDYGETIKSITERYGYWFDENLKKFAADPNQLPVDMHELIALTAPRPVYVTGAEDDRWADPKGEFLACVAAAPVFELFGKRGLGTDQLPPLNQPIMHDIGFHIRTGKHEVTSFDWDQFLAFADMHLRAR